MAQTDELRIICPKCKSILRVAPQEGIEKMDVICPVCKAKNPMSRFERAPSPAPSDSSPRTKIGVAGAIIDEATHRIYHLVPGRNIIGRAADTSRATIQIKGAHPEVSREHIIIDVIAVGGGFAHRVALFKSSVNPTFLNGVALLFNSPRELRNYDRITIPGMNLRFRKE